MNGFSDRNFIPILLNFVPIEKNYIQIFYYNIKTMQIYTIILLRVEETVLSAPEKFFI